MNPNISVDINLYFEITNGEMYGGIGTIGYASANFEDVKSIENVNDDFIKSQIKIEASLLSVNESDVRLISREEYEINTCDSEDEESEDI